MLPPAQAATYLVLPFFNVSKNSNLDWIGESLAESVREALSSEGLMALDRDERIEAYSRLSLRPYALLTKASVVKIGEELDAEQVIFGQYDVKPVPDSPTKSRGSLLITARVLDLKHVKQGPEFREVGALEDLAALQEHLAWQTLRYLKPASAPSEAEFQQRHPAVRVDAVENYTRGLLATNADDKHRFFTQAAHLDCSLFPARLSARPAALEQEGVQLGRRVVPKGIAWRRSLSRSEFFPGPVPLSHRRLCRRRSGVPDGGARSSLERGVQRPGGRGIARQYHSSRRG